MRCHQLQVVWLLCQPWQNFEDIVSTHVHIIVLVNAHGDVLIPPSWIQSHVNVSVRAMKEERCRRTVLQQIRNGLTTGVGDALERIVNGEHDGLDADLAHCTVQSWRREMTRCRNKQLITEIVAYQLIFAHRHIWEPAAVELVVDTIDVVRTVARIL